MQYLRLISASSGASWYAIEGDHQTSVRRYVVSTPQGRAICNRPEIVGCDYTTRLREAVGAALATAPFRPLVERQPAARVCVLNFLRGGLNFGLREALHEVLGLNIHTSAFMSSQRYRVDGRWQVREDMYRKLRIPGGALVLAGDVVATGVTVENGLRVLVESLVESDSSVEGLIFFTIGCHKLEKCLADLDPLLREAFPGFQGSHAVYLEGKLRLVDSRTGLRIGIPGTDLIRRGGLLAPEFAASQYERVSHALERCAIYDAGSRAFDVPTYVEDVAGYWHQVATLAREGLTLAEALAERWPEDDWADLQTFLDRKSREWRGVGEQALVEIHRRRQERWTDRFRAEAATSEALEAVCAERIAALEATLE